jgi:trigger factor
LPREVEDNVGTVQRRPKWKRIMQVTETLNEGLKHEFKINVPASDLGAKADAKLVDLKDKVRLNGFRPGKVPVAHLKKIYGRSVMAETVDQTIRDTNTQIFTERGFRLHSRDRGGAADQARRLQGFLAGEAGRRDHRHRDQ